jgi:predicted HTH domain antitoxin
MILELPDTDTAALSPAELRLELACALYSRGKISAVTGSHLAGVDLFKFQAALKERKIPRNYTLDDLQNDVNAVKKLFPA